MPMVVAVPITTSVWTVLPLNAALLKFTTTLPGNRFLVGVAAMTFCRTPLDNAAAPAVATLDVCKNFLREIFMGPPRKVLEVRLKKSVTCPKSFALLHGTVVRLAFAPSQATESREFIREHELFAVSYPGTKVDMEAVIPNLPVGQASWHQRAAPFP
jgi:hypothetical protein